MPSYILTEDAEQDLIEILRYTYNQWSENQAIHYIHRLKKCCEKISQGDAISKAISKKYPQLKTVRCEHHYIFFMVQNIDEKALIIAFLHKRMNFIARLKKRLK